MPHPVVYLSLRIIRLDLSGTVRVTSTGRFWPLTSGSHKVATTSFHWCGI